MNRRLSGPVLFLVWSVLLFTRAAYADDTGGSVSRKEYLKLQQQVEELKRMVAQKPGTASGDSAPNSSLSQLRQEVSDLKSQVDEGRLGETQFLATGNLSAGFIAPEHGDSNFSTTFSPIFLWKLSDKLMVESEIEFELEDSDTSTKLEYAQLNYSLNDYLSLVAGKFLSPMNVFVERYEPKWINKFPDTPLAVYDGILPESHVGAQVRGAAPVGEMKVNYVAYVGNGARLNTDEESAGTLEFDNFSDTNGNKSFGGRVGFLPLPNAEIGYGLETGSAGDPDGLVGNADYTLQSVDFDYLLDSDALSGRFNARVQYAWSSTDSKTYDPDGALGFGPANLNGDRDGGYVQVSYRPTRVDLPVLPDFEFVLRYDQINNPSASVDPSDDHRTTVGVDYWLDSATVFKIAYEVDDRSGGESSDAFLTQVATGF